VSMLELRGLTKRFPGADRDAVCDVSLRIEAGEIVGLVGGSGAGKTTLLRLIAGLEVPTAGSIVLNGRMLCDGRRSLPPEQRGIGLVFQDYALFPHLTVEENVGFGLHRLPRRRRRERIHETLELVGLADLAGRYPHQLSGGQQQRAALARALAPEPAVLLLDEPFSNLDAVLKPALRDDVSRILRRAGTTALVVVHDHEDVLSLADRVAILRDGRLWQVGSPREVFATPRDDYVARLFGETNLVVGVVENGTLRTPLGPVPTPPAAAGRSAVTVSVRPFDILLAPDDDVGVRATVRRVAFRAGFDEVELVTEETAYGTAAVVAHVSPGLRLAPGDAVRVRIRPGGVQVVGLPAADPHSDPSAR
jgi:iron(III) transport system ATP-binding protein